MHVLYNNNNKVSLQTRLMAPPIIGCGVPRIEREAWAEVVMRSELGWRDEELGEGGIHFH